MTIQSQQTEQAQAYIAARKYALLQAMRQDGAEVDVIDIQAADYQAAEDPVHFWVFEDDYAVSLVGGPAPDSSALASDAEWVKVATVERKTTYTHAGVTTPLTVTQFDVYAIRTPAELAAMRAREVIGAPAGWSK
jgi:hypothetical protein